MPTSDHAFDLAEKVRELLQGSDLSPFVADDVYIAEDPRLVKPRRGICISPDTEREGRGNNELDGIWYRVMVTRILPKIHHNEGILDKAKLRTVMRTLFNRKRLGIDPLEQVTRLRYGTIHNNRDWDQVNLDTSVIYVECLIWENREVA